MMPSHPRYSDEPEFSRDPRSAPRRERDPRAEPRESRPRPPMDVPQSRRNIPSTDIAMTDDPMDIRLERGDPRANTTARVEPRAGRPVVTRPEDVVYEDPRTGQLFRGEPRRTPYQDEFNDMPPNIRPIIDPGRGPGQARPEYNEYFLPGDGIDREVIQSEICRYLGQDATCKPGNHHDGRRGYIIRAYRALTTEMIRSLKEDSGKYIAERERAGHRNQRPVPYAQMRDQSLYREQDDNMMIDDREEPPRGYLPSRHHDPDPRISNRLGQPPVTTTYISEPGYPAVQYPLVSAPPPHGIGYEPRYPGAGNTTPPGGRPVQPGYAPANYLPANTRSPAPAVPATTYRDPRTGETVSTYQQYPADPSRRHRT